MAEIGHIPPSQPLPPVSPEIPPRERRPRPGPKEEGERRKQRDDEGGEKTPGIDEFA